jgi:hypothetical protein
MQCALIACFAHGYCDDVVNSCLKHLMAQCLACDCLLTNDLKMPSNSSSQMAKWWPCRPYHESTEKTKSCTSNSSGAFSFLAPPLSRRRSKAIASPPLLGAQCSPHRKLRTTEPLLTVACAPAPAQTKPHASCHWTRLCHCVSNIVRLLIRTASVNETAATVLTRPLIPHTTQPCEHQEGARITGVCGESSPF